MKRFTEFLKIFGWLSLVVLTFPFLILPLFEVVTGLRIVGVNGDPGILSFGGGMGFFALYFFFYIGILSWIRSFPSGQRALDVFVGKPYDE